MMTCLHCGGLLKAWSQSHPLIQKATGLQPVEGGTLKLTPRLDRPGSVLEETLCPSCQRSKELANY